MTKKLPCSHPCRDIFPIEGTDYVLLPDNRIARLLTPTLKSGKAYVALYVEKKRTDFALDVVVDCTTNKKPLPSPKTKTE